MKNAIIITLLVLFSVHGFGQDADATAAIDPLDNYIDPATNLDYTKQLSKLNPDQADVVFERCIMFTIQQEMGQTGEAGMSTTDIEAYEELVANRCKCVSDNGTWVAESSSKGQCKLDKPAEKDLLLHTMDLCVDRMQLSDKNCKAEMTPTCVNDFRYQCYQYMTQPQEFSEKSDPVLNSCQYDDQTKNIKMECRSYCYHRDTCQVKEEGFANRTIGNIYLLKKKSRSSCVKGSTYGIDSKNKMWVNNSCHGEFAIQYKDPKCGFRPVCTPKPHVTDHIADDGTQTFIMACDGKRSKTPGGKLFCTATPMKVGTDGKVTTEPDPAKEVTRVTNITLDKKIGAARCNPGSNGSPVDFSPRNKGLDGGWGIEVQRKCHASFKVTVKWRRKLCTMAGQKTSSRDTCCNGLYFDPKSKTCSVPAYDPKPLEDEVKLALDYSANACSPTVPTDAQGVVDKYFVELGYYENMFSIIDGKSDGVSSILYPGVYNTKKAEFEGLVKTMGEEIQVAKDASIEAKQAAFEIKDEELKATAFQKIASDLSNSIEAARNKEETARKEIEGTLVGDKSSAPRDSTYDSVKLLHDGIVRFRTDWSSETVKFNTAENFLQAQNDQYATYLDNVDKKTVSAEEEKMMKTNVFAGLDVQSAAHESQKIAKNIQISYILAIDKVLGQYVADIEAAALVGQNLAWYCAHTENCSQYNWMIRDKSKEEVIDFLHDAPHPFKLVQARGRMLPKITKVNKLLVDSGTYEKFENSGGQQKGLGKLDELKQFFSYQAQKTVELPELAIEGDSAASKDAERVLNLFRQYSNEFPLRETSMHKDNEILANYLETSKDNASGLPEFCSEQDAYKVRVPMGKAIEPLRMLQMVRVVKKFYSLYLEAYQANEQCLIALEAKNRKNNKRNDLNLNLTDRITGTAIDDSGLGEDRNFMNGFNGSLLDNMSNTFEDAAPGSFLDNLNNRKPGDKNLTASGDELNAVKEKARVAKLIKRRIGRKGDTAIDDYIKSLDSTLGATLSSKARKFASLSSPSNGATGLAIDGNANSAISDKDRGLKKTGLAGSAGKGNAYGSRKKINYGNSKRSSSNGTRYGGNSGGANSGSGNSDILAEVNDKKFDSSESDSLFEKVTKRYIRTAYPVLLEKKSK